MSHYTRFVFLSDVHGDQRDEQAVNAALKFCKIWKPQVRVCGGDAFDLRAIRRGASDEEKRESMVLDYDMGWEFLHAFKPTVFLQGNHEVRAWNLAQESRGLVSDYARKCVQEMEARFAKLKCQVFPYDRRTGVFSLGKLNMVHGYGGGGKTTARTHAIAYGRVLAGHTHAIDYYSLPSISGSFGMTVGCLCKLDMPYLAPTLGSLTHAHGWAYGICDEKTGDFRVWQAEKIGGQFIAAGEPLFL